jgi:hypothetical protein
LLDITHVAAWITDDTLRAQVTLAGTAPRSNYSPRAAVRISVSHDRTPFDLPVCAPDPCGSYFTIPRFSTAVTQYDGHWVVDYSVNLDELGTVDVGNLYTIGASTFVMAAADPESWWSDGAPDDARLFLYAGAP